MKEQVIQYTRGSAVSVVTPRFLLRVGGLSINCVDELHFERSVQWQNALLSLEGSLIGQKSQLVDSLHGTVSMHKENRELRRKLINLKRNVFNMHLPGGTGEAYTIAPFLQEDARELLYGWLNLWERYQQQLALGPDILESELQQKRSRLKEVINNSDFRKGILLSSPVLAQAIDSYIASDNLHLKREARTVERSLLEYLFRTTAKTSPFSTFTPVSIGTIEAGRDLYNRDIDLELVGVEKQSFTRLNMVILSRLSTQILACLEVRKALLVQVTNGWRLRDKRIEYIRRKPVIDTSNTDASLPLDFVQEYVIQLPASSLLQDLLEFMGNGNEEKLGDIIAYLCTKKPYQHAEVMVEEYLQHLLRLGLLIVPALQVDIHHNRPLEAYCQKLRTISAPQTDALAHHLEAIASLVDSYVDASLTTRATIVEKCNQLLQQCGTVLGVSRESMVLPKTVLYEDTVLTPQRLAIREENWTELFANLQELQQLLPILDTRLPQKIMARGYFQARYGVGERCDDVFSFADRFNQEFLRLLQSDARDLQLFDSQGNFRGQINHFNQPEIEMLNNARLAIVEGIRSAYQALPTGSDELVLEENFFRTIAPLIPDNIDDLRSHTFFSQFARVNNEPLLILNQIYSGLTLMFSRFAYCFAQDHQAAVVPALRSVLQRLQPPDAVFAELKGGYDATNLNLHPTVTPYELVCPGELSTRPQEEQLPLEDLFIQDNVAAGRLCLYSKRLGKEVIPVYLGFLTLAALPEIQQTLLTFSYLATATLDLWRGIKMTNADTRVVFSPRLRYKQIVLQRATWRVHSSLLPQRKSEQTDADFYLAMTRWRKELGLPTKVFFTPVIDTGDESRPATVPQSYKPVYIDFENYFSVMILETIMRKTSSSFRIVEMLPQTEQLWFKHNDQAYISEFLFEVSRTRRSHHEERLD